MKTRLLLLFLLCLQLQLEAQPSYMVTTSKATYAELSGATDLPFSSTDSGYYLSANFMFKTFGKHYANFRTQQANPVSAGGFMTNNGLLAVYDSIGKSDVIAFQCFEGFRFSIVPGITSAAFKVEGTTGNRILKCQWKNLVHNNIHRHTANFQIWLHEADGSISYRYGPNSLPPAVDVYDGGYSGIVVVKGTGASLLQEINLEGKPSNPVVYRNVLTSGLPTLDSIPPNGTVYTFRFAPNSVEAPLAEKAFGVFPNPATHTLQLKGEFALGSMVSIYDGMGRRVQQTSLNRDRLLNVRALPHGVYTVIVEDADRKMVDRFVKKEE